jgi:peptidoglycan/LPS O-acetylase OafA/YrhL
MKIEKENGAIHFPGLNALRFFAAMIVLVTHVEFIKKFLGHNDNLWIQLDKKIGFNGLSTVLNGGPNGEIRLLSPLVTLGGYMGVVFFFVLSGFLITYLLIAEREESGTVQIRKFYLRRILRIWPLYLLLVLLGFFVLPYIEWFRLIPQEDQFYNHFILNFICYVLMVPNLAFSIVMEGAPNIGHLWSVGVEEQFYLFWPLILAWSRRPLKAITIFIALWLLVKIGFLFLQKKVMGVPDLDPDLMLFSWWESIKRLLGTMKFECMALGGVGAWLYYHRRVPVLKVCYSRVVEILSYTSIVPIIYLLPKSMFSVLHILLSIPFLLIILNVATNEDAIFKFRWKRFNVLGKISYGIYMYHFLSIMFCFNLLNYFLEFPKNLLWWHSLLLYALSIGTTIGLSYVSYAYFEKAFLMRKKRYSVIHSSDDVNRH